MRGRGDEGCGRHAALLAEYHDVNANRSCLRSDEELLVAVRTSDGTPQTVMPRIDAAEGLSACDNSDLTTHLEVSPDGSQVFASFDSGGLWRLRPSPLQFFDQNYSEPLFRLHPDGSVLVATVSDGPTTATVSVFKVSADQVARGALPFANLVPCGIFQLPNNRLANPHPLSTQLLGFAAAPPVAGSRDGTILVSVLTATVPGQLCADNLSVRGTIAFSSPADSSVCTPIGLINLEGMDVPSF